jgi:Fic family protein
VSEQPLTSEEIAKCEERGFVAALRFVTSAATARWPTLADANELHRLIFAESHPGIAGQYRLDTFYPQYIRFPVPLWNQVGGCMVQFEKLLEQAKQEGDALEGHAQVEKVIEWAARLHHRYERIHPFQDGNGRSGRLLATWMLLYYNLPPFEFTVAERDAYLDALAAADEAIAVEDLQYPDFYPHQTEALQSLIDFMVTMLLRASEAAETEDLDGP